MEDNIGEEYIHYWETAMFLQTEELERSWGLEEAISGYYDDSSSPDGAASSAAASKNIESERNRRKKLNERLFALRAVVPNITKMDKASIIKDAIAYIENLHEQERRIREEVEDLESRASSSGSLAAFDGSGGGNPQGRPRKACFHYGAPPRPSSPIEILELRVTEMGERTVAVSVSCSKRKDTMVRLCEVFQSLNLKIITANITAFSGILFKTVFLEADEGGNEELKMRIEMAIAALNDPQSPMSI